MGGRGFKSTKGETDVVFKGLITATAGLALMAAPTVAAAQAAPTLATETVSGSSALGGFQCDRDRDGVLEPCGAGGFLVPLLALGAVILGLIVLLDDDEDDDDLPISA